MRYLEALLRGYSFVDNPIPIFLARLFMLVNAPPRPIKGFRDTKKAIEWLQQYKNSK